MNYWLFIIIPVCTALTGWIILRFLVYMLFHPRKQKNILGIRVQGVLPGRQQAIADKLGILASTSFLSFEGIEKKISDPTNLEKILPFVENHIDDFLRNRLGKEMPMISMFIGDKTIGKLKEAFMKEIGTLFPQVMKEYASGLKKDLDVGALVTQKIAGISAGKLENIFYKQLSRELRLAGLVAAAIGFILGLLQAVLLQFMA